MELPNPSFFQSALFLLLQISHAEQKDVTKERVIRWLGSFAKEFEGKWFGFSAEL